MQMLRSIFAVFAGLVLISVIAEALEFGLVALVNGEVTTNPNIYFRARNAPAFLVTGARSHSDGSLRMGTRDSRASAIDSGLDVGLFDRYDICRSHDWLTAPTTPHAG
jgi:hypothetical protein